MAPTPVCDLFASPSGSDSSGNGSVNAPFASVPKLDQALSPGQTGCLRAGSYGGLSTWYDLVNSGSSQSPITISSYPGETAKLTGWVDIEASYTTLENVSIDGSNTLYTGHPAGVSCTTTNISNPLVIAGHNDILQFVDYSQSVASLRGNAIGVGFWGNADNTIIRNDKIHDVGGCQDYDHLIYLSHGNNVQIYNNWMWNDPHGWGVQLYPAPTNARIFNNVIDHAGSGFIIGNETGDTVTGNQIFNNIITNSTGLPQASSNGNAIQTYWGGTPGTNNTFTNNIYYNNPDGLGRPNGIQATNNTNTDPQYINPATHNYQTQTTSPDTPWNLWN
jgi:hypothetical protein